MDYQYAVWAVGNPATSAEELSQVAEAFPQLGPQIVAHPNCFPELEAWLSAYAPVAQVGEPAQVEGVPTGGKSRKGLFIGLGVAAFVLLGGGVTAAELVLGGDEPAAVAEPAPSRSVDSEPEPEREPEPEPVVTAVAEPMPEPIEPVRAFSLANAPVPLKEMSLDGYGGGQNGKYFFHYTSEADYAVTVYELETGEPVLQILEETEHGAVWSTPYGDNDDVLPVLRHKESGSRTEYWLELINIPSGQTAAVIDLSDRLDTSLSFITTVPGSPDLLVAYRGVESGLPTVARLALSPGIPIIWQTELAASDDSLSAHAYGDSVQVFVQGSDYRESRYSILDIESGEMLRSGLLFSADLSTEETPERAFPLDDGTCAPFGAFDEYVSGLDSSTGEVTWQRAEDPHINSFVCSDSQVIYGVGGRLVSVDSASGVVKWDVDLGGSNQMRVFAADGDVLLTVVNDHLVGIDKGDGSVRWEGPFLGDAWDLSVHLGQDTLFVATYDRMFVFGAG